jgi:hypothetical protein
MRAGTAAAVALAGMIASGSALASDGNKLLDRCQQAIRGLDEVSHPSDSAVAGGHCLGLVEGVMDLMEYYRNNDVPDDYKACFPKSGLSTAQAARIVEKYLKDSPAILHENGTLLVVQALHKAFPCKK